MENILPSDPNQKTEDSSTQSSPNSSVVDFETKRKKYKHLGWTPSPEQELYLDVWLETGSEKKARKELGLRPSQVAAWRGEEGSGFKAWVESQITDRAHNAIIMLLAASINQVEDGRCTEDPADRDKATKMMMAATKYLESRKKDEGEVKDLRDLSRKVNV